MIRSFSWIALLSVIGLATVGCGPPTAATPSANSTSSPAADGSSQTKVAGTTGVAGEDAKPKRKSFKPVELGSSGSSSSESAADSGEKFANVRAALKPLQILIGSWNGTSRNAALDQPGWAWDLKTDPKQPALKIKSEKGKYIRDGRLTFHPSSQEFEFTATDGDGKPHNFRGAFSEPVQDVLGDDC